MPGSAAPTESSSPSQGHRKLQGGHDPVEMGRRGAAKREANRAAKREAMAAAASQEALRDGDGDDGIGLVALGGGVQPIPGLAEALASILRNPQARDADVISAVRALAELQAGQRSTLPTSVAQVQAMGTAELHALVAQLEVAHPWPDVPRPALAQS